MDFGRLAYLRVEELENAVRSNRTERIRNTGFSVRPRFNLNAQNSYRITNASGRGRQSLLVTINVDVQEAGRVAVTLGGQKLGFSDFNGTGNQEQMLMLSCRFTDTTVISLTAQNGFRGTLLCVQIILIGEAAHLSRRAGDFGADESGDFLGVLFSRNERLQLNRYPLSTLQNPTAFAIGHGGIADVCGDTGGGFYIAYADNNQNVWLTHIDVHGAIRRLRLNEEGVQSLAVTYIEHEQAVLAAFIKNGRVYTLRASLNLTAHTQSLPFESERAEQIAFVKGARAPALLSVRAGRIFLRKPFKNIRTLSRTIGYRAVVNGVATFNVI